jgi:hypothetical protein
MDIQQMQLCFAMEIYSILMVTSGFYEAVFS